MLNQLLEKLLGSSCSQLRKRQNLLDRAIDEEGLTPNKLKDACRTHWIQRLDSYVVFLELLPTLHKALQAMTSPNLFQNLGTGIGIETLSLKPMGSFSSLSLLLSWFASRFSLKFYLV